MKAGEKKRRLQLSCTWAPLEKPWAHILGSHPWPFIIGPTLLTICLSSGIFMNFKIVRGVHYLYAPLDAPWKTEEEVFHHNWAATDEQFYPGKDILRRKGLYLIAEAKDGGNVLRPDYARDFLSLLDWLSNETFVAPDATAYSYHNICLHFQNECFSNTHARLVADVYAKGNQDLFNVTYPMFYSRYSTEPIDLSKTLGNATLDLHGHLKSATAWMILYQLKQHSEQLLRLSSDFEVAVSERIRAGKTPTSLLNIYYFHSDTFELELAEGNRRITPKFTVTFVILVLFSVVCTFNLKWPPHQSWPLIDWVLSKPAMGVVGVVTTLMAIVSAMGLLLLFKVTFVDMCTVMPFLSLTVGIDDTFLMLAAWHETSRHLSVEDRIETSMRHAAVSISITSITDALAFLIGAIAPLPAGRWEEELRNSLTHRRTTDFEAAEKSSLCTRLFNLGSRPEREGPLAGQSPARSLDEINNNEDFYKIEIGSHWKEDTTSNASTISIGRLEKPSKMNNSISGDLLFEERLWYQRFFEDVYAPFICTPIVQLINIIQMDSPSRRFMEIRSKLFPEDLSHMDVAVLNPPNLGNSTQREAFMKVLERFETTEFSSGRNTTDFWYFAYQDYIDRLGFSSSWDDLNEDEESFNGNLKPFLMANERYDHDILYFDDGRMRAFRFSTQIRDFGTDERVMLCAQTMRGIANDYPEYEVVTYTPLWSLADQFEIMWPQTIQDLGISIAVMIPISLLFIPQPLCAVMISVNIASIALGVIGFMAWWHVNLDATSMITIAMSVGFSVDFAAHITYGYMTESKRRLEDINAPKARLVGALGAVGWPVSQASISVLLGITSLALVDSYVVQTCFKTILLVVVFGMVHALLFLPLILMHAHNLYLCVVSKVRRKSRVMPVSGSTSSTQQVVSQSVSSFD